MHLDEPLINCQACSVELRLEDTDVISLVAAAHYQESNHCCPYCHTVLLLEVTMGTDDAPTGSTLAAMAP